MPSGSGGADLDGGGTQGRDLAAGWKSPTSPGRECPGGRGSRLGSPSPGCRSRGGQPSPSVSATRGTAGLPWRPRSWTHMTGRLACQLEWLDQSYKMAQNLLTIMRDHSMLYLPICDKLLCQHNNTDRLENIILSE